MTSRSEIRRLAAQAPDELVKKIEVLEEKLQMVEEMTEHFGRSKAEHENDYTRGFREAMRSVALALKMFEPLGSLRREGA